MRCALIITAALAFGWHGIASAVTAPTVPTTVGISGGGSAAAQTLPALQSNYGLRVPLRTNAQNDLVVAASNSKSPTATKGGIKIMQIALQDIVLARVEARRLTVQEVKTLVADGTIQLSDPANFNVSLFVIVLTIADQPVEIRVPVVKPKDVQEPAMAPPISIGCGQPGQPLTATETAISIPCGDGGGGRAQDSPPQVIIPFVIDVPDAPFVPPIPGVIVIEGRIKTLKEFFNVSLILSNVSSVFTLTDIQASLEVPAGKMTLIKPTAGPVMIDDLPPGSEKRGDFITRGDKIGVHTVTAHFSGHISGLGIDTPIAVSGQAATDIEVKGPPKMDVRVEHPSSVRGGEPYELTVEITNTDAELPALYTSFALDVGADARIVDPLTGLPRTTADVRQLGDILPGEKSVQKYTILPLKTGPITSCTAGATENLRLDIAFVGAGGPQCAIGTFPSEVAELGGEPTVIVVPTHNTVGVTVRPAVTAIFSAQMLADTITTGFAGASYRLLDPNGNIVPSSLEVSELGSGRSLAILRPFNQLNFATKYTVEVTPDIFDVDGRRLASGYAGRFTTEASISGIDIEAPTALLTIEPPIVPTAVPAGQRIPLRVDAFDNVGIDRVDLRVDGEFVDSQPGQSTTHFMLDTTPLASNQPHVVRVIAFDARGNQGIDQATVTLFSDQAVPTIGFVAQASVPRGRHLSGVLNARDNGGVARAEIFVDGEANPFFTSILGPFQFAVPTGTLPPGAHTLRGVVRDAAGNEATTLHTFQVTVDGVPPVVAIFSPTPGAQFAAGALAAMSAAVTDDIGVDSVRFFLDAEVTPRATGFEGFNLDTATVPLGTHTLRVEAADLAGNAASASVTFEVVTIVADTTPPAAPVAALVAASTPVGPSTTVSGVNGAVESNARVEVVNLRDQASAVVEASFDGGFVAALEARGGDTLRVTAIDKSNNRSASIDLVVPAPPVLLSLAVTPATLTLGRTQPSQQLVVTGTFDNNTTVPLASGVTFASANPLVAAVTATGLVLPGQNGNTMVTVTAGGVPAVQVPVAVGFPTVAAVEVSPTTVAVFTEGAQQTRPLALTAVLSDGFRQPFTGSVLFASQIESIASVDSGGVVTGVSAGATTVTVAPSGFPPIDVPVTVTGRALASIAIAPSAMTFIGAGQAQVLTVTGTFNDGSTLDVTAQASCSSEQPAVAMVAGIVVTSAANGDATIRCSVVGVPAATATVRVKTYQSIAVSPNPVTLIGAGKQQALSVVATFTDASTTIVTAQSTFGSNDGTVATVDAAGVVRSVGVGTATVTATFEGRSGTTTVSVNPRVVDGLTVAPPSLLFTAAGATATLTVTAHFNDGTFGPTVEPLGFQTSTIAVASVSTAGVVTAVATGQATITVNSGAFSQTVPVNVAIPIANPPPVISRIDRPRAAEGDQFVIDGANFSPLPEGNLVTVGGLAATVIGARKDQLVALIPVGAASGTAQVAAEVQVTAHAQSSNLSTITIYQRKATSLPLTPGIDEAVPTGTIIALPPIPPFEVRADDRILLSSAPDILAPLAVTGTLEFQIDGGAFAPVPLGTPAAELTGAFTVGTHTLQLRLVVAGGQASVGPVHVIAGPDATGPIAGEHHVVALGQSRPIPVTFTNLVDLSGTPLPDGSQVVVSLLGGCTYRDRNGNCVFTDGGAIPSGGPTPEFGDVSHSRRLTVTGGRLEVLYDPAGVALPVSSSSLARVQVLPAFADGTRNGTRSIAIQDVTLTSIDTAAGPRSQSVVLADGAPNLVSMIVDDIRDGTGTLVPDGAVVVVSTLGGCNHRDRFGNCLYTSGGSVVGGFPNPDFGDTGHTRAFTVTNGQLALQYDPSGVTIGVGQTPLPAIVQLLPGRPNGSRIGQGVFEQVPIQLTSPFASATSVSVQPASVLADNGDRRVTITVSNITDGNGVPVPNGAKVVVSTLGGCNFRYSDGNCIFSSGGNIIGGAVNPDFGDRADTRVFSVQNGQLSIVYSSSPVALGTRQTATAIVSVTPATPSGARIGIQSFVTATVTLAGVEQASIAANPTSIASTGVADIVNVSVTGMLDAGGAPVPDGSKVVVSTLGGCNFRDRAGNCVHSAGGEILGGAVNPDFGDRADTRVFTVQNGGIAIQYNPAPVLVGVGSTATSTITVTPARPDGSRIGQNAFAQTNIVVTPPTTDAMHVTVAPTSVLADGGNNEVVVTVTNIADALGRPVPDGAKVTVSALGGCNFRDPGGNCVDSPGGTIVGGGVSADYGNRADTRVFAIAGGQVQIVYRPNPVALGSPFTGTARLTFTATTPGNSRIGVRAFAIAEVALTSPASATIPGPGSLAPNATATYTISQLRDTSNVLLPEGTQVQVSVLGGCNYRDINGGCVSSAGGTLTGGFATPDWGNVGHTRFLPIIGGQVSIDLTAPASGTTVLMVVPVTPAGSRIGTRAFAVKSIAVTP